MEALLTQLAISLDLEQNIVERALALGYSSPEEFLRSLLSTSQTPTPPKETAFEEFARLRDELAADEDLPSLPANFSQTHIYGDHF